MISVYIIILSGLSSIDPFIARAEVCPDLLPSFIVTHMIRVFTRCSIIIYLIKQSPAYYVLDIYIFHMCDACLEDNFSKGYIICPSYYIRPTLCNAVILFMPTDD